MKASTNLWQRPKIRLSTPRTAGLWISWSAHHCGQDAKCYRHPIKLHLDLPFDQATSSPYTGGDYSSVIKRNNPLTLTANIWTNTKSIQLSEKTRLKNCVSAWFHLYNILENSVPQRESWSVVSMWQRKRACKVGGLESCVYTTECSVNGMHLKKLNFPLSKLYLNQSDLKDYKYAKL